jgi:16S rRNA (cytosine967-C5)-methyltransferase
MAKPAEIRARAARLLNRIIVRKETSDQVLAAEEAPDPLLMELLYGSLRHYFSLNRCVEAALAKPLRLKDHDLKCLMIIGLYQLHHTRIPPHAAVHETVNAARHLRKPWAAGLVNAVMQRAPNPERSFEHPPWMERALELAYGSLAPSILLADNERAPMALRINRAQADPAAYRRRLGEAGLAFRDLPGATDDAAGWGAETLVLMEPTSIAHLPGYREGLVGVQDAGAQLTASVFGAPPKPASGARVLDACAAPGGKLFHLMERWPETSFTALDSSATRMETLTTEARRLKHECVHTIVGDGTTLDWWDGTSFSHVLIDAPCSGSGTLRRHPDIKVLRQAGDLPGYAALQSQLLATLWKTLGPGGTLLYCTCSLFPAENDDVIDDFLSRHPDAAVERLALVTGQSMRWGWQLLPTDANTDGFYFARMRKIPG